MALIFSIFPSVKPNPDLYYEFLKDIREDAFIGGVDTICREVTALYPNTNLVALIRKKAQEWFEAKAERTARDSGKKALELKEPDYAGSEEYKKGWNELLKKLAAEKDANRKP